MFFLNVVCLTVALVRNISQVRFEGKRELHDAWSRFQRRQRDERRRLT
jgi:hypothetical protein